MCRHFYLLFDFYRRFVMSVTQPVCLNKSISRNKGLKNIFLHLIILALYLVPFYFRKMSLLILADSQIERVWRNVRQNREILRTAEFVPVKRFNQMHDGFKAMKATVRPFLI